MRSGRTAGWAQRLRAFALELAAKDAALIVEAGEALGAATPVGAAVKGVLDEAVVAGLGGADWSELVAAAEHLSQTKLRFHA